MDILYILGTGSKHNNDELRYSLRSLERYGNGLGRVYLVGECPEWLNTETVTYIPFKDKESSKFKRIWAKIVYAVNHCDISDDFLLSSDDIFHVKPIDLNNYPYYHKNGLYVGVPADKKGTKLWAMLEETKTLLRKYKYPMEDYGGGHCLHHFSRYVLNHSPKITKDAFAMKYGGAIDVIMGNALVKLRKPVTVPRKDIKLTSVKNEADFYRQIGGTESFSTNDTVLDGFVGKWLAETFSEKSRFEL